MTKHSRRKHWPTEAATEYRLIIVYNRRLVASLQEVMEKTWAGRRNPYLLEAYLSIIHSLLDLIDNQVKSFDHKRSKTTAKWSMAAIDEIAFLIRNLRVLMYRVNEAMDRRIPNPHLARGLWAEALSIAPQIEAELFKGPPPPPDDHVPLSFEEAWDDDNPFSLSE